jgi:hypothetical protein
MRTLLACLVLALSALPAHADNAALDCGDALLRPSQAVRDDVFWRHRTDDQSFERFVDWFEDQEPKVQASVWWALRELDRGARLQHLPKVVSTTETGVWEIKPQGRTTSRVFIGVGRGGYRILFGASQVKAHPTEQNRLILRAARMWSDHQRGSNWPT